MEEGYLISKKIFPGIEPHLHIWHWQISIYLFLGGLAAGVIFFSALFYIMGKDKEYPTAVKWASFIAPVALAVGLLALVIDLHHKLYVWRLYTTINWSSPMSWGAWTLLFVTPLSMLWSASYISELFPNLKWKNKLIIWFENLLISYRMVMAWFLLIFAVIVGIYTGVLLSALVARPLWNNSVLGPLFLTSGLSTGAASIMLLSKSHTEIKLFSKIDLILIFTELILMMIMFSGLIYGSAEKNEAAELLLGGEYMLPFFGGVVILGLLLPSFLELLELKGFKVSAKIPALLVIIGGVILRFVIVNAGQVSGF